MSSEDDKGTENTNIEKSNKNDLIDDVEEIEEKNKEEEHENENENNISNGLSEQVENGINGLDEIKEKPKLKKYIPKTEQEEIKARIINLEMN
jgi:hypothetical protein